MQHLTILIAGSPSAPPLRHLRSPSTLLSSSSSLTSKTHTHLCLGSDDHSRGEPSTSNLYHRERSFSVFLVLYIYIILYYTEIFFFQISFSFYLLLRILLPSRETKWHLGILSQASALLGDECIWACICSSSELLFFGMVLFLSALRQLCWYTMETLSLTCIVKQYNCYVVFIFPIFCIGIYLFHLYICDSLFICICDSLCICLTPLL